MVRNGEITVADVKRILRRYWWILAFITVTLGAMGLAASLVLPKKYTSSTLVLVEQPTVPTDVIKPVITNDLNQRMASMKAQILSRSRLEPIINKFELYPVERKTTHMEDLVEKLKSAVHVDLIEPLAGSADRQPPGFNVSVTFDNPQLAQQICQEITSMFMEQNATARGVQSNKVTKFLTEQLDEAKAKLAEQDKSLNESLLSNQEASWKNSLVGLQNPETQDQELATLQQKLSELLAKYTPEHPDVIKMKAQIEELNRKMAEAPALKPTPSAARAALREPPAIQQLRSRIKQDDFTIADMTKRQGQIQDQIRSLQGRLQASPVVEQQLKELTRSYQTASDIYNELLKKRENSAMATDLEHAQQGENFRVLDAPSLPSTPSFPKKIVFVGGSLGAGLALSLGILYLLAVSDKAMYSERDVEVCLKLPVLTSVPSFDVRAHGNG